MYMILYHCFIKFTDFQQTHIQHRLTLLSVLLFPRTVVRDSNPVQSVCVRDGSRIVDPHSSGIHYSLNKSLFLVKKPPLRVTAHNLGLTKKITVLVNKNAPAG